MEEAAVTLLAGCAGCTVLMELESDPCDALGAEESDVAAAVLDAVCEFDGLSTAALARPDMEAR